MTLNAVASDGVAPAGEAGRIAIMQPRFSRYGGSEQFGYRLAAGLAARGHSVDVICARKEVEPPEGVRVLEVGRPPGVKALKLLWFLIGAEKLRISGAYDVSISLGKTLRQDISRMGGGPLSIFWKESERAIPAGWPRLAKQLKRRLSPANWLAALVEKQQFGKNGDVVAVSHLVRDWLLQAHPDLAPERVSVIYNRPDTTQFSPPSVEERLLLRERLAASCGWTAERVENSGEVVFIGTASTNFELKGVEPLIRALAVLPDRARLLIAGGRESDKYQRLAESLGIADRVRFLGRVDDMSAFYKALDIFILPTFYDACSNAVLEALASGCKVLTSASNGAAFFLDAASVFPDASDVTELAKRLTRAMEAPEPAPFIWPENIPSGVDAFIDLVERRLVSARRQRLQDAP